MDSLLKATFSTPNHLHQSPYRIAQRVAFGRRFARSVVLLALMTVCLGAGFRTPNFIVTAGTPEIAQQVGQSAELFRKQLAIAWLGRELRDWSAPCPITVQAADHLGAGGATSFIFDRGEVSGWQMTVQGSSERILDSVLPHEVLHTVFASYFRRKVPRWADEGACTIVEHTSERAKQHEMLVQFLRTDRGISFNRMFTLSEYPRDVLPLYAQGHSLVRFLVAQGGRQRFVEYLSAGMERDDWATATGRFYGYSTLSELQAAWLEWVRRGSSVSELAGSHSAQQTAGQSSSGPNGGRVLVQTTELTLPAKAGNPNEAVATPASSKSSWYLQQRERSRRRQAGSPVKELPLVPVTLRR